MKIKSIKISEKGQIAIPKEIRQAMKIQKGDSLLLIQQGNKLFIEKISDEFESWLKLSEGSAKEVWDNEIDEVWNNV